MNQVPFSHLRFYNHAGEPIDYQTWQGLHEMGSTEVGCDQIDADDPDYSVVIETLWVGTSSAMFTTIVFASRNSRQIYEHRIWPNRLEANEGHKELVSLYTKELISEQA